MRLEFLSSINTLLPLVCHSSEQMLLLHYRKEILIIVMISVTIDNVLSMSG